MPEAETFLRWALEGREKNHGSNDPKTLYAVRQPSRVRNPNQRSSLHINSFGSFLILACRPPLSLQKEESSRVASSRVVPAVFATWDDIDLSSSCVAGRFVRSRAR